MPNVCDRYLYFRVRWRVRTLPWLRGCVGLGCAPAGTTVALVLRVLAEHTVVPVRRAIPSDYIFAQRKTNPRCGLGVYFRCLLSLCCPVRGTGCAIPGRVLAGTMVALALRVLAEPTVIPVRRAIASDYMCARHMLSDPRVVFVRR